VNYEAFRRVWHEALDLADLRPFFRPSETVNLQEMSRLYRLSVSRVVGKDLKSTGAIKESLSCRFVP
jgi:hypothetical protein